MPKASKVFPGKINSFCSTSLRNYFNNDFPISRTGYFLKGFNEWWGRAQKCPQQSCLHPQLPGLVWSVSNMQGSQRTHRQGKRQTYGQGQSGRVSTNGNSGGITPQLIAKGQPGTQVRGAQIPILRQHLPVQSALLLHWCDSLGCSNEPLNTVC